MTNKRAKAEALYAELREEGYVPPAGKSIRGVFIDRAVTEFGMTEKGAATYYVNAKKRYEGGAVPSYYKAKTPPPAVPHSTAVQHAVDTRWSVIKIEDGKVTVCAAFPTEEKARSEFKVLRPENKAMCMVIPGVMRVGEQVSHVSEEETDLVAAEPGDTSDE
ncbi:hypothetical protein D3C75_530660 [compost metagenome]